MDLVLFKQFQDSRNRRPHFPQRFLVFVQRVKIVRSPIQLKIQRNHKGGFVHQYAPSPASTTLTVFPSKYRSNHGDQLRT